MSRERKREREREREREKNEYVEETTDQLYVYKLNRCNCTSAT
jgi:hypothetical protein